MFDDKKKIEDDTPTEEDLEDLFRPEEEEATKLDDEANKKLDKALEEVEKGELKKVPLRTGRNRVRGPNGRIVLE